MSATRTDAIAKLRACREALVAIPKDQLTGPNMWEWFQEWDAALTRSDHITDQNLRWSTYFVFQTFGRELNPDIMYEVAQDIIARIDWSLETLDAEEPVRPILESHIALVADTKLATLLREFNAVRISQPNLAAIGFRTVLALVIRERLRKVDPSNKLAITDDINPEPLIKAGIDHPKLFSSEERKHLNRFLNGGPKDTFDSVVHKPERLIEKEDLESAVNLLNVLLPTIAR